MHVHEKLAQTVLEAGTEHLFGLVGDGNLFFADSFRRLGGRYVDAPHEATAVSAAAGYAGASGRIGAATVTHGPGLYNTLTALTEAARARIPLVLVVGDTDPTLEAHIQDADHRAAVGITGAGFVQLRGADTVVRDAQQAFRQAATGQRPVALNVPASLMWTLAVEPQEPARLGAVLDERGPSRTELEAAVGILASARRPLVLVGRGATDGIDTVLGLARRAGAAVATTLRGTGLDHEHPGALGVMGTLSSAHALETVGAADCVLAFGASLNRYTTDGGALLRGKRVIHVDRDAAALGRHTAVDATVLGDAAATARLLHDLLDDAEAPPSPFAGRGTSTLLPAPPTPAGPNSPVELRTALRRIDRWFDSERTVVLDAGRFWYSAAVEITVRRPRGFVQTAHFGAIGMGMGAALGAAVACPQQATLVVVGDGGFMLSGGSEFNAAVRHGLDLTVVLVNDHSYGAEHIQMRRRDLDPTLSTFAWPSFADLATALGGAGHTVSTEADLDRLLSRPRSPAVPTLIEVCLDPDAAEASRQTR